MRIWRGCRSGGAPDQKVARLTEQTPLDQIEVPDQLDSKSLQIQSGAATERALNVTEWVQATIIYNEVDIIKLRT